MNKKGRVHIFTGNGRGKTSAALGNILRASGYGLKVFAVFFMKGEHKLGEYKILSKLKNVDWEIYGRSDFFGAAYIKDEDREYARKAYESALKAASSGKYDLVVMDEINTASHWGLISVGNVLELIDKRAESTELILTGRYADPEIIKKADQVTELLNIKHAFDKGLKPKKGIDF